MKILRRLAPVLVGGFLALVYAVLTRSSDTPQPVPSESELEERQGAQSQLPARPPIVVTKVKPLLTNDSNAPDYDPTLLIRFKNSIPSELFESEPRAEDWAQPFETHVQQYVEDSLADISVDAPVSVACRTAICKVDVDVSSLGDESAKLVQDYLTSSAPIGNFTSFSTNDQAPGQLVIFSVLSPDIRTTDGFDTFTSEFAQGGAERIETQKQHIIEMLQPAEAP